MCDLHVGSCTVPEFTYYHDTMLLHVLCTVVIVMCEFPLHLYMYVIVHVHVCKLNNVMYYTLQCL